MWGDGKTRAHEKKEGGKKQHTNSLGLKSLFQIFSTQNEA